MDEGGGEGADCGDGVEVVDRDAEAADGEVVGVFGCEFHYLVADGGVEEADSNGGSEACSAWLDGGEGEGALEDVLGCFAGVLLVSC